MTVMGDYGARIKRAVRAQVRAEIAAKGLIQADVARMTGMPTSSLSRLLNDDLDRPFSLDDLGGIAEALGLPPHVIAERAERRMREEEAAGAPTTQNGSGIPPV